MASCCSAEPGRRHKGSTRLRRHDINSASLKFLSHGLEKNVENKKIIIDFFACVQLFEEFDI